MIMPIIRAMGRFPARCQTPKQTAVSLPDSEKLTFPSPLHLRRTPVADCGASSKELSILAAECFIVRFWKI
ncbi:hypothetical protein Pfo_002474 [Paulownia fortunei]|nr:hypothetical protein Pfo_002474 [Paulownia fortunei]